MMHIENLLFLLLIAIAVLFRLLASKVSEAKKGSQEPDQRSATSGSPVEPIRRAPVESDEERIRRFLEALGQPAGTRPPPPVAPRTDIPPRPLAPVQPPIAQVWKQIREERRKREVIPKESPPTTVTRAQEIAPPKITAAPIFEVHEGLLPVEPPPIIKTPVEAYAAATRPAAKGADLKADIATLLASKSGLRNAIILREIFGPPRGMQPLQEMSDSLAWL
jgi:hypothetical protein